MLETTIIISMPGCGVEQHKKNNKHLKIVDIVSYGLRFIKNDNGDVIGLNPNFIDDVITLVKNNIGNVDIIYLNSTPDIINAMDKNNIPYILVYPERNMKDIFLGKYSDESRYKNFLLKNWDNIIDDMENNKTSTKCVLTREHPMLDIIIR